MRITVIGTGYVGLVTGTCFSETGNDVVCVDINEEKVQSLRSGQIPIYEPGLADLVHRNTVANRLDFTTDLAQVASEADVIFLAVGTPASADGSADLSALWAVADSLAPHLQSETIVVTKSTVPVGTNAKLYERLNQATGQICRVVSNPEFLKEGAAIADFTKPDRVVVGVRSEHDAEVLRRLYSPFLRTDNPFLVMSPESAELTKYVANALLATKISFINQMANVCESFDADINDVRRGIGHDSRIGFSFLFPGVGYGGSCFPKDVRALAKTFIETGLEPRILEAVDWVNEQQKSTLHRKIEAHFEGELAGKKIAVWGLAFKPKTDDVREAPALILIDRLLQLGAIVTAHDPEAMNQIRSIYGTRIQLFDDPMEALEGADALAIPTEWQQFRTPDFSLMQARMAAPVIFDGRNIYEPDEVRAAGFVYYSIGRGVAEPEPESQSIADQNRLF
ncbi:MAG: UDP-glucose 6-dehydrogenase [Planctomycetaceae bacterium]|nr:UDP-glucose 6-dehydrogenase [Planctomycetaceae bacterium]